MSADSVLTNDILQSAETLRWEVGPNFHEQLMEDIYADAAKLADRAVTWPDEEPRFDLDRTIDRIVTSRMLGLSADDPALCARLLDHHRWRQHSLAISLPKS